MENLYNIGIECEEKAFKELVSVLYESGCIVPTSISKNENNHYLIYYSQVMWDVRYPDIKVLQAALNELDAHQNPVTLACDPEYGYAFAKLGREYTDIELRSNTDRVEYPLKREINKDGFDEEVTYEPQEEKEVY